MIDLKAYRANPAYYHQGATNKGHSVDRSRFDQLDAQCRELNVRIEQLQWERNSLTKDIEQTKKSWGDATAVMDRVKALKQDLEKLETEYNTLYAEFYGMWLSIPCPAFDDVPVGKSDAENVVMQYVGEKRKFEFTPKPHWEILEAKWMADQERAVKLSGARFQIIRRDFARLEFALIQRAVDKLTAKWFIFSIVPNLVKKEAMITTGFLPNDASNLYRVNPKCPVEQMEWEEDDLYLIGTAEVALVSQHMDEVLSADDLPLRYVGFSACFRREAWTYGKDTKGMIRVHQFEKVEMVSFVKPEDAAKEHELLVSIEEEIFQELGIPYQKLMICTGDLGGPAAKKYDLEAWFPGIDTYKEVTSTSNTTDYQTRRGNIKFTDGDRREFVYSLNGTAVALGRALAAIVENYQTAEWNIAIPTVLQPYMWGKKDI